MLTDSTGDASPDAAQTRPSGASAGDPDTNPVEDTDSGSRAGTGVSRRWQVVLPVLVIAAAAFVYMFRLASPPVLVFDEIYYARDARSYRLGATELTREEYREVSACDRDTYPEGVCSWVHPPLGKFIIAAGEQVGPASCPAPTGADGGANCTAFQWRFASALAGILATGLVLLLAFVLLRSWIWASVAGALFALDGLTITSARIAMLDIFLVVFVVAGFLLLALETRTKSLNWWLRIGAGVAFGAALATKWAGGLALGAAWLLAIAWIVARRRRGDSRWTVDAGSYAIGLIAVPIVVYLSTWIPYLAAHGWSVSDLAGLHEAIGEYHLGLEADHPYKSPAWQWPLLIRPTAYHFEVGASGTVHVLNIGNPVFWWLSIVAVGALVVYALKRISLRAAIVLGAGIAILAGLAIAGVGFVIIGSVGFALALALAVMWLRDLDASPAIILVGYSTLFLPWLVVSRPQFLFYMAPAVPFMALACVWAARWLWDRVPGENPKITKSLRGIVIGSGVLALIAFGLLFPVWTALPIPNSWWQNLMLVSTWI